MLVKIRREEDHLEDLRETFSTLHSYNMKLNPGKCAFGVMAGKFLGFMVSQRGIEANPDKIRAIMEMAPPRNVKEVQSLNGKIAALNRFGVKEVFRVDCRVSVSIRGVESLSIFPTAAESLVTR